MSAEGAGSAELIGLALVVALMRTALSQGSVAWGMIEEDWRWWWWHFGVDRVASLRKLVLDPDINSQMPPSAARQLVFARAPV